MRVFESPIGSDFDTSWARTPLTTAIRRVLQLFILRPGIRALTRPQIISSPNQPLPTPLIVVANHTSHLDTSILLTTLPRAIRSHIVVGAAADYFFDTRFKSIWWALSANAVPIERVKVGRRSAQQLESLINENYNVILFPEGGRSTDGTIGEFKPGAAYLSVRAHVPVLPVYIEGARKIMGKGMHFVKPGKVRVVMGSPMFSADDDVRKFAAQVEKAVHELAANSGLN